MPRRGGGGGRREPRPGGVGCSSSNSGSSSNGSAGTAASADTSSTVKIDLTSQGCAPKPATVPAGPVEFDVTNSGAGAVSEAELRTSDLSHILGEQENLTPGLSGGFSLTIQPGTYTISCPGAPQSHWTFTVTGKATGPSWQTNPQLVDGRGRLHRLRQPEHGRPGQPHPDVLPGHQRGEHDPGQGALPAGPRLLRADRAGGRGLGQPGHQHRRPVGEPGHGRSPSSSASTGSSSCSGRTRRRSGAPALCAGLVQERAAAADAGAARPSTTRWRWPAAPPT